MSTNYYNKIEIQDLDPLDDEDKISDSDDETKKDLPPVYDCYQKRNDSGTATKGQFDIPFKKRFKMKKTY